MSEKKNRFPIAVISAAALSIVYFDIMLTEGPEQWLKSFFGNYEILIYICGCAFFSLIFTVVFCVDRIFDSISNNGIFLSIMFIGILAINDMFENSRNVNYQQVEIYYTYNKFILIFLVVAVCIIAHLVDKKANEKIKSLLCVGAAVFTVLITIIGLYSPNIVSNDYQILHNSATFDAIYNLYMGEPISRTSFGTYGHYEFFYLPWFKLLGLTMKRYVITQCALGAVTILLFIYCVYNLISNKIVRAISILCMSGIWGQMTYATVTHTAVIRIFPTAIISAIIVFCASREFGSHVKKLIFFSGYAICALLILWNPEMGIVSAIGWAFFCVWKRAIGSPDDRIFHLLLSIIVNIVLIVLSFIGSFFLCNLFNRICGGEWVSLSTYMIPYTDKIYMTDGLILPLQKLNYPWFWVVGAGLIVFIKGWADILTHTVIDNRKALSAGSALSVILLAGVTYFINRSAAGCLWIVYLSGIVVLALLCDEMIYRSQNDIMQEEGIHYKKQVCNSLKWLSIVLLCGLLTCVGFVQANLWRDRFTYDINNESEKVLRSMMHYCPPDTHGIGLGIPLLYSRLGWDDRYHLASEIFHTEEGVEYLKKCLLDDNPKMLNAFVLSSYTYSGLLDEDIYDQVYAKFDIIKLGEWSGYEYWYLVPIN